MRHRFGFYILMMLSAMIVIFKPFLTMEYVDNLDIYAQSGMFFACLFFVFCTKQTSEKRKLKTNIDENIGMLQLLQKEEDENEDDVKSFNLERNGSFASYESDNRQRGKENLDVNAWNDQFNEYKEQPINSFYNDLRCENEKKNHYEPMDVCSPHRKPMNDPFDFNTVGKGLHGLDLNNSFGNGW